MAGASLYLRKKWLGTLNNTAFSVATCYLALHSVEDPGDAGTVGAVAVARQAITWGAIGSNSTLQNTNDLSFTGMPAVTVKGVSIWDALTGGNCLITFPLAPDTGDPVAAGNTYVVDAADLTFTVGP